MSVSSVTETSTAALGKQGDMLFGPDQQFAYHQGARSKEGYGRRSFGNSTGKESSMVLCPL